MAWLLAMAFAAAASPSAAHWLPQDYCKVRQQTCLKNDVSGLTCGRVLGACREANPNAPLQGDACDLGIMTFREWWACNSEHHER